MEQENQVQVLHIDDIFDIIAVKENGIQNEPNNHENQENQVNHVNQNIPHHKSV